MCGTGISSGSSVYPGMCNTTCPGNAKDTQCGGVGIHAVYYNPDASITNVTATSVDKSTGYIGCYSNPKDATQGLQGTSVYSYSDYSITIPACLQACANRNHTWASLTQGKTCYCGDGSLNLGQGMFVPDATCIVACGGNSSQICGYTYGDSVYSVATAGYGGMVADKPAGYKGTLRS